MEKREINRHQRRRMRTIAQLMEAALVLLLEKGYDSISIQDITYRADLGRGTFYIYFHSKEEIVWEILKDGFLRTTEDAIQDTQGRMPEAPEYFSYVNIFRHAQLNRDLYRVMLGGQRIQEYLTKDFIDDNRRYGIYAHEAVPMPIFAQIITGALFSLLLWWLENPNEYSPEDMAAMLRAVLQ
jgi:AcrR family transcriptional regulator